MQILKRGLVGTTVSLLMILQCVNFNFVSAASKTYIIDNDDAQGYTNASKGFSNYLTGNTLYHSDARTQKNSSTNGYYYQWNFPQYSKTKANITARVGVYLYHDYFTDRYANYMLRRKSQVFQAVGRIDQRYAAAGWTYKNVTVKPIDSNGSNYVNAVVVEPGNKDSTAFTGADAVKVTLS